MKYKVISRFNTFLMENLNSVLKCEVMDSDQLSNLLGIKDNYSLYLKKLNTLAKKIKYFDRIDYEFKYVVLYDSKDIVGLIKFKEAVYTEDDKNGYGIWYISINEYYIGRGYSKQLLEQLFIYAKVNDMVLYPSYFSADGSIKLRKYFSEFEKKYNVEVIYVLGLKSYLDNYFINDLHEYNRELKVEKISNNEFVINGINFLISDYFLDKINLIKPDKKYILIEVNRNDIRNSESNPINKPNIIEYIHITDITSLPYKINNLL